MKFAVRRYKSKVPQLLARFTFVVGIFNIFANVFNKFKLPAATLDYYFLVYVNSTAFATAVLTGFALIFLARGLKRKKRRAWQLAIVIVAINLFSDLFRFHRHPIQVSLSIALLMTLALFKDEFYAKSDPTTRWRPFLGFVVALPALCAMGLLLIYFRHSDSLIGSPSFSQVFSTVLTGMVGLTGPVQFDSDRVNDTVGFTLGTFGVFTFLLPLWLYLRRVKDVDQYSGQDLSDIQQILVKDPFSDSLSYFATRKDKKIIWSANRKAGLAYRVENGVALASGDPFGEFSLWPEVIDKFLSHAAEFAWTPAVVGCTDRAGELWIEKTKMIAIDIGDEAVVVVDDFTLEGRAIKNVREMVKKVARLGYTTQTCKVSQLTQSERIQLINCAHDWRYGASERGFSMALDRFLDERDSNSVITVAKKEEEITAFLHFVPWGANRLSLDRMQRSRNSPSGVNEALIAESIQYARSNSLKEISLNFALFKSVFERADKISAGRSIRIKRNLLRLISRWFQVESLYRFNDKFQPEWRTRYLLLPAISQIIPVGIASAKAENFIDFPKRSSGNSKKPPGFQVLERN